MLPPQPLRTSDLEPQSSDTGAQPLVHHLPEASAHEGSVNNLSRGGHLARSDGMSSASHSALARRSVLRIDHHHGERESGGGTRRSLLRLVRHEVALPRGCRDTAKNSAQHRLGRPSSDRDLVHTVAELGRAVEARLVYQPICLRAMLTPTSLP